MNIEKILPKEGPSKEEVKKYIEKYSNEIIVIKCGGSVLLDKNLFNQFIEDVSIVNKLGLSSIVIHGGGKNIKKKLDEQNIDSNFINCKEEWNLYKNRQTTTYWINFFFLIKCHHFLLKLHFIFFVKFF